MSFPYSFPINTSTGIDYFDGMGLSVGYNDINKIQYM